MEEILKYVICAVLGGLLAWLGQKIANRKRYIRYTVNTAQLGFSANDEHFGNIRIIWNDTNLSIVHFSRVEIQNTTGQDIENFIFNIYTRDDTIMLVDAKYIQGSSNIFDWSPSFYQTISLKEGHEPVKHQVHAWHHNREYMVPVFNRSETLQVQILTTGGDDGELFVDTRTKGVHTKLQGQVPKLHGVPVTITLPLGVILAILGTCMLVLADFNGWITAFISMLLGFFSQSIAAIFFKVLRWPMKFIE